MNKNKEYTAPTAELHVLPVALRLLANLSNVDGSFDVDDWEEYAEEDFYTRGRLRE